MLVVIKAENLGKKYTISHHGQKGQDALRDVIAQRIKDFGREGRNIFFKNNVKSPHRVNKEEFWALQDITFEANIGDRIGIIGKNGAGKTTLLKLISRITEPSSGLLKIKGRVASLLEIGTGFHQELTGRENIFLNGAILGMHSSEIKRKFDEIVEFSGVERFLDTPVKRYSSGMYVRLAFAVAAHLEPEILAVDEILAVGDAEFQKKCLGKMDDMSQKEGRTVFFVSHNMTAIKSLCSKGILLNNGKLVCKGSASEVVTRYISQFSQSLTKKEWEIKNAPGNDNVKLLKAEVRPFYETNKQMLVREPLVLEFTFLNLLKGSNVLDVTFHLFDEGGTLVFVGSSAYDSEEKKFESGLIITTCIIPGDLMHQGNYSVGRLCFVKDRGYVLYEHRDVLSFDIVHSGYEKFGWMGEKEGTVHPRLDWRMVQRGF